MSLDISFGRNRDPFRGELCVCPANPIIANGKGQFDRPGWQMASATMLSATRASVASAVYSGQPLSVVVPKADSLGCLAATLQAGCWCGAGFPTTHGYALCVLLRVLTYKTTSSVILRVAVCCCVPSYCFQALGSISNPELPVLLRNSLVVSVYGPVRRRRAHCPEDRPIFE